MAALVVTALYALIFIWVTGSYLRRRDPLLRDVMLIFASVACFFALVAVRLFAGPPPSVVSGLVAALVLGQPFFSLRLASRVRRVPPWVLWAAGAAWLVSVIPVVVAGPPRPEWQRWPIVVVAFVVEVAAAALLAAEAGRRGGAARMRLACAAIGTGLFGVVIVTAGVESVLQIIAHAFAVVSALMYMLAFLPPRQLRRMWSWGAAYALMRRMLAMSADGPADEIWRDYCRNARDILGADAVMVLVRGADGAATPVCAPGPATGLVSADDLDRLLGRSGTIDALAGWNHPPRLAADMAAATGTRYVTVAALDGRAGALVLLHRQRTLFIDDDVALFRRLARQATALAQRADVLAERQRLAVIVEASDDAIIGKALDGTITSWNAGARRLFGYDATEVIGKPAAMLFPAGQERTEEQVLARVIGGERINQLEVENRRKDGTVIPVSLTSSLITDATGQPAGVACITRDIGERERAEAMFRGLLEAAPDAIIGVTEDGLIALMNAQAERMFGYRRDELLGQSVELLVPEGVRAHHPQQRRDYFADPQPRPMGAGMALSAVRKDGSEFPAEISLSALQTDQGMIVSAAVRDVTERLQAQAERERLAAQAERDAVDRRMQHTRRLESLGQLAGGVAHDFNNILAVIASYTELLTETLAEPQPDPADLAAARNDLAQISRATERATRLTKQLLAFGRREITQAQVLSLNHVVGDVEQMLRRTLGEHIHLITHLDRDLWPVCADPGQVEQVLVNLAVNARDAMPTGGTLSIDTGNTHLDEDDVAECPDVSAGRYVRIRVSDSGAGMPPEVAERAFEPFFTTKPQGAGTGLGLATVYGIAAAAGGHVRLHSEPGIGTTVTLVLPASDAAVPAPEAEQTSEPAKPAAAPRETILLVEDEDALREATGRSLRRAGYQVLVASGGKAALKLAEEHPGPIHLLLTDVMMPVMMGNEVAERVRRIRPETPVLYMSGYAQPVLTENGTLPEGVAIIEKPFTRHDLLDRVHARLHQADAPGAVPR